MAAFGWSVGDLVSAISVVAKVCKALKDAGGAVDDYRETVLFLESLNITLTTLHGLYQANVDPTVLLGVHSQLELVQKPIDTFTERVKRKLGPALDGAQKAKGMRAKLKRARSKLEWAFWIDKESQLLNQKILVPLTGIQIQLGIHIHSVISNVADDIIFKVAKNMNDAFPALVQQSLAPIADLEHRHHAIEHTANTAIYRKIESLPQMVADNMELSLVETRHTDNLRSQKLEDYCSLLVETIDRVEERLQQNNIQSPPKMSDDLQPLSQELSTSDKAVSLERSVPNRLQRNENKPTELAELLLKSMIEINPDTGTFNAVGVDKYTQQSKNNPTALSQQAWAEAGVHFKHFILLLVQAFREFFIELWPIFACFLYQAKIMQKCVSRLPSLLSKENITFVDALGRSRRIPYMTYGHWQTFSNFVLTDFQKIPGEGHVQKGRYALITSDGTTTLNESNWKRFVLPDVEISMVVQLSLSVRDNKCPRCKRPSNVIGIIRGAMIKCENPNCQLKYRLIPFNDRITKPQITFKNRYLKTSSDVSAWLEVASSLKRVEYANMREKANALALTDASNNPQFRSEGPEPYRHLLGVKRITDKESYIGNEIRAHTGALKARKQEITEFQLYFKNVQCNMFPLECEFCGFCDFEYPDELPQHMLQVHTCIYTCLFDFAGCQHAFAREDQWRCHVTCEHLNWLCDTDQCPNEKLHPINHYKKDWYLKSKPKHASALQKRADRANAMLRASLRETKNLPSKLTCPIEGCERAFDGGLCWSDRMEHIEEHITDTAIWVDGYLCSKRFMDNSVDELFVEWALGERIVERVGRKFRLVIPE